MLTTRVPVVQIPRGCPLGGTLDWWQRAASVLRGAPGNILTPCSRRMTQRTFRTWRLTPPSEGDRPLTPESSVHVGLDSAVNTLL